MSTARAQPSRWVSTSQKKTGTSTSLSTLSAFGRVTMRSPTSGSPGSSRWSPRSSPAVTAAGPLEDTWRSVLRSAGHVDHLAGDERGLVAGEERHHGGDVLGVADAAHGDLLRDGRLEVLEGDAHPRGGGCGHVRGDEARRDRVRGDPERPQLDGQGLREALQARLGGRVVHLTAVAERRGAGEVDDAAPVVLGHEPLDLAGHQEGPAQVDGQHGVPVVVGHLEEHVVADDPGVVDQHRGAAEPVGDALHGGGDLLAVGDVDTDGEGPAACGGDGGHRGVAGRLVEVQHGDGHPVGGQSRRDRGPDPACRAGDHGDALPRRALAHPALPSLVAPAGASTVALAGASIGKLSLPASGPLIRPRGMSSSDATVTTATTAITANTSWVASASAARTARATSRGVPGSRASLAASPPGGSRATVTAVTRAPKPATPTALPSDRLNMAVPVTRPRSSQPTDDCTETMVGLATRPIPMPATKHTAVTVQRPEDAVSSTPPAVASRSTRPPPSAVSRKPMRR